MIPPEARTARTRLTPARHAALWIGLAVLLTLSVGSTVGWAGEGRGWLEARRKGDRRLLRCMALRDNGDWQGCIAACQELLLDYPRGRIASIALLVTASCQENLGEFEQARETYHRIMVTIPYTSQAEAAKVASERLRRLRGAEKEYLAFLQARSVPDVQRREAALRELVKGIDNGEVVAAAHYELAKNNLQRCGKCTWREFSPVLKEIVDRYPDSLAAQDAADNLCQRLMGASGRENLSLAEQQQIVAEEKKLLRWRFQNNFLCRGATDAEMELSLDMLSEECWRAAMSGRPELLAGSAGARVRWGVTKLAAALPEIRKRSVWSYVNALDTLCKSSLALADIPAAKEWAVRLQKEFPEAEVAAGALLSVSEALIAVGKSAQGLALMREVVRDFPEAGASVHAHHIAYWWEWEAEGAMGRFLDAVPKGRRMDPKSVLTQLKRQVGDEAVQEHSEGDGSELLLGVAGRMAAYEAAQNAEEKRIRLGEWYASVRAAVGYALRTAESVQSTEQKLYVCFTTIEAVDVLVAHCEPDSELRGKADALAAGMRTLGDAVAAPEKAMLHHFEEGCALFWQDELAAALDVFRYVAAFPNAGEASARSTSAIAACLFKLDRHDDAIATLHRMTYGVCLDTHVLLGWYVLALTEVDPDDTTGTMGLLASIEEDTRDTELAAKARYARHRFSAERVTAAEGSEAQKVRE